MSRPTNSHRVQPPPQPPANPSLFKRAFWRFSHNGSGGGSHNTSAASPASNDWSTSNSSGGGTKSSKAGSPSIPSLSSASASLASSDSFSSSTASINSNRGRTASAPPGSTSTSNVARQSQYRPMLSGELPPSGPRENLPVAPSPSFSSSSSSNSSSSLSSTIGSSVDRPPSRTSSHFAAKVGDLSIPIATSNRSERNDLLRNSTTYKHLDVDHVLPSITSGSPISKSFEQFADRFRRSSLSSLSNSLRTETNGREGTEVVGENANPNVEEPLRMSRSFTTGALPSTADNAARKPSLKTSQGGLRSSMRSDTNLVAAAEAESEKRNSKRVTITTFSTDSGFASAMATTNQGSPVNLRVAASMQLARRLSKLTDEKVAPQPSSPTSKATPKLTSTSAPVLKASDGDLRGRRPVSISKHDASGSQSGATSDTSIHVVAGKSSRRSSNISTDSAKGRGRRQSILKQSANPIPAGNDSDSSSSDEENGDSNGSDSESSDSSENVPLYALHSRKNSNASTFPSTPPLTFSDTSGASSSESPSNDDSVPLAQLRTNAPSFRRQSTLLDFNAHPSVHLNSSDSAQKRRSANLPPPHPSHHTFDTRPPSFVAAATSGRAASPTLSVGSSRPGGSVRGGGTPQPTHGPPVFWLPAASVTGNYYGPQMPGSAVGVATSTAGGSPVLTASPLYPLVIAPPQFAVASHLANPPSPQDAALTLAHQQQQQQQQQLQLQQQHMVAMQTMMQSGVGHPQVPYYAASAAGNGSLALPGYPPPPSLPHQQQMAALLWQQQMLLQQQQHQMHGYYPYGPWGTGMGMPSPGSVMGSTYAPSSVGADAGQHDGSDSGKAPKSKDRGRRRPR